MSYYISHSGTHNYFKVKSKTLRGAKTMASRFFHLAGSGSIEVFEDSPYPDNVPVLVAIRHTSEKHWKNQ